MIVRLMKTTHTMHRCIHVLLTIFLRLGYCIRVHGKVRDRVMATDKVRNMVRVLALLYKLFPPRRFQPNQVPGHSAHKK